jgi:RNA-binding protein Musashi
MKNPNVQYANKIFIGGLSCSTTQNKLKQYFQQFGAVIDCVLMVEKETGRSRGYGFVIMKNTLDVPKVL